MKSYHGWRPADLDQELEHYLRYTLHVWMQILLNRPELSLMVDFQTVQLLQTRCPALDHTDAEFVKDQMCRNALFPKISDIAIRSQILQKLLDISSIIPSLATFFEDTKWLEPVAKITRRLLPTGNRQSTRSALYRRYVGSSHKSASDTNHQSQGTGSGFAGEEMHRMTNGYRELCAFAWRHFPDLIEMTPRKDKGIAKPPLRSVNKQSWTRLGQLGKTLGFESEEITALADANPDLGMVTAFLDQARPKEFYKRTHGSYHTLVTQICSVLDQAGQFSGETGNEEGTEPMPNVPLVYRCGRPHEKSFIYSRRRFFLDQIYSNGSHRLSYFTVQRDIIRAFFGMEIGTLQNEFSQDFGGAVSCVTSEHHNPYEQSSEGDTYTNVEPVIQSRNDDMDKDTQVQFTVPLASQGETPFIIDDTAAPEGDTYTDVEQVIQSRNDDMDKDTQVQFTVPLGSQGETSSIAGNIAAPEGDTYTGAESVIQSRHKDVEEDTQAQFTVPLGSQGETSIIADDTAAPEGDTEPVTQSRTDNMDALFMAETVEDTQGQFTVPLGSGETPTPSSTVAPSATVIEKNTLAGNWKQSCKTGDWFVVSAEYGTGKHIQSDDSEALRAFISSTANNWFYACYSLSAGCLKTVDADLVERHFRHNQYDGVVYLFKAAPEYDRDLAGIGFDTFRGGTTEERLNRIEQRYRNKRTRNPNMDDAYGEGDPIKYYKTGHVYIDNRAKIIQQL